MRGSPKERGVINHDYETVDNENWPKTQTKKKSKGDEDINGKGKVKWYNKLPYADFVEDLPMLRYVRGARAKIHITTFDEINKVDQQIFECHKSFFRFRAQVDLLAHYIGSKILEQIYIVKKNHKKYPLSDLLEEQEKQFEIWDQMKTVKELFSNLCEKKENGFITDEEMKELVDKYIDTFSDPDSRIKMASVLDFMIEQGEEFKAKERLRKKETYKNRQKQKEYEIEVL